MSKHTVAGGDGAGLLELLGRLRAKAEQRGCGAVGIVCIQEAGFEGFWVHRLLTSHGIESHVVDPASVAVPRSEEHTSELQSRQYLVCRLLLEKKKKDDVTEVSVYTDRG